VGAYEAKYPQAVECLIKTKEETMAFYGFPLNIGDIFDLLMSLNLSSLLLG